MLLSQARNLKDEFNKVLSLNGNGDGKHAILFTGTNQLAVSFVSQFPTISVHYISIIARQSLLTYNLSLNWLYG